MHRIAADQLLKRTGDGSNVAAAGGDPGGQAAYRIGRRERDASSSINAEQEEVQAADDAERSRHNIIFFDWTSSRPRAGRWVEPRTSARVVRI